MEDFVCQ